MNVSRALYRLGLVVIAAIMASCGTPAAGPALRAAHPPTPLEILARPGASGMRDAHLTFNARYTTGSSTLDLNGQGIFILRPKEAISMTLHGTVGPMPVALEVLSVDGKTYQRAAGQPWALQPNGGPLTIPWATAHNPTLIGQDELPLGKAWHLRAVSTDGKALEIWVRERDGYPLRVVAGIGQQSTAVTMSFDQFDTGATLAAPLLIGGKP